MGIRTVAVYSDPDAEALHVDLADDAFRLGPAAPSESYLNIPRILDVAKKAKATMVHPGYGFLAENADFVRAVTAAGLTFIGPSAESMERMGDKAAARRTAQEAGAPLIPGTLEPVDSQNAEGEAERIGYPLVVKAAFGGGGKGMQLVHDAGGLREAAERSAREAKAYFGRPEVYLERYIERAHHVEVQIIADAHGHVSFLGERDCTLQRRYQKLVEETPSPVVTPDLRARMGEAAVAIARAAGYVNAGTIEFLVDEDGSFFFMEMNTRLQVEHPVTEMVTGRDLVRLMILVAMGEAVEVEPAPRGHAIECRINAEDPYRDFLPGPGAITAYDPPAGPFVRVDSGVAEGKRVVGDYDSLFAKLIVWGEDREQARRRMLRALDEFRIAGVPTTIPFHQWVLDTKEFREATAHTRWVEAALAEGGLLSSAGRAAVGAEPDDGSVTRVPATRPIQLMVEVDGHRLPVRVWGKDVPTPPPPPNSGSHAAVAGDGGEVIPAPMQGTILKVLVERGQAVQVGETLCILEAMKMENHIVATREGTVADVAVSQGDVVETGQRMVVIE